MPNSSGNNVCFIANFNKTYFFHELAQELQRNGYEVFWVVVNSKLYRFLQEHYPQEKVLYISKKHIRQPAEKIGEFKLNELIYGDRSLKYTPEKALPFLVHIQKPLYNFFLQNEIRFVVGEVNWAHEILIHRIISRHEELRCTFLNPHTIRIPNGRFAFFTDEYQTEMLANNEEVERGGESYPPIKVEKPAYLKLNDSLVRKSRTFKERLMKLKRFVTEENIDDDDPTLISEREIRLKIRSAEELNKELYRMVDTVPLSQVQNLPYVFLALHKQPEASIDVLGRYYEDQYQNIINIWRVLPDDWILLVKEHTNALGDRGLQFYRKLSKIRNVLFLDEATDSHEAIRRSRLVVSVSGTVAYEAALMGKPAWTFAPTFFNRLATCRHITLEMLKNTSTIHQLLDDSTGMNLEEFTRFLYHHSFEGIISDPVSDPRCMEPENIQKVTHAMEQVISAQTAAVGG